MGNEPLIKIDFKPGYYDHEYIDCVFDLLDHRLVKSMENYIQHGDIDCLQHSINVSYNSYLVCKYFGLDYSSAARGGLLHDFFLYDWHNRGNQYKGLHGLNHPKIALKNSKQSFHLNRREQDIILKHMWPLTIRLPKYSESLVVIIVDKYCAIKEMFHIRNKRIIFSNR